MADLLQNAKTLVDQSGKDEAKKVIKQELVPQTEGYYELKDTVHYNINLNDQQSTCECIGFASTAFASTSMD